MVCPSVSVSACQTRTHQPRQPLGDYGRNKAAIELWLLDEAKNSGLPATVLHPGHIVGPGWTPLNPAGNFNPQIFDDIAQGREILLPNMGIVSLINLIVISFFL